MQPFFFNDTMRKNLLLTRAESVCKCKKLHYETTKMAMENFVNPYNEKVNLVTEMWPLTYQELLDNIFPELFVINTPLNLSQQVYAYIILRKCSDVYCSGQNTKGLSRFRKTECYSMINNHLLLGSDYHNLFFSFSTTLKDGYTQAFAEATSSTLARIIMHRPQQECSLDLAELQSIEEQLLNYRNVNLYQKLQQTLQLTLPVMQQSIDKYYLSTQNINECCCIIYHFFWLEHLIYKYPSINRQVPRTFLNANSLVLLINHGGLMTDDFAVISQFHQLTVNFTIEENWNFEQRVRSYFCLTEDQYNELNAQQYSEYHCVWKLSHLITKLNQFEPSHSKAIIPLQHVGFPSWSGNCNFNTALQFIIRAVPHEIIVELLDYAKFQGLSKDNEWKSELEHARFVALHALEHLVFFGQQILKGNQRPQFLSAQSYRFFEAMRWLAQLKAEGTSKLNNSLRVYGLDRMEQDDVPNLISGLYKVLGLEQHNVTGFRDIEVQTAIYNDRKFQRVVIIQKRETNLLRYFAKNCFALNLYMKVKPQETQLNEIITFKEDILKKADKTKPWNPFQLGMVGANFRTSLLDTEAEHAIVIEDPERFNSVNFVLGVDDGIRKPLGYGVVNILDSGGVFEAPVVVVKTKNNTEHYFYGSVLLQITMIGLQIGVVEGHYIIASKQPDGQFTIQDDFRDSTIAQLQLVNPMFAGCKTINDVILKGECTPFLLHTKVVPDTLEYNHRELAKEFID